MLAQHQRTCLPNQIKDSYLMVYEIYLPLMQTPAIDIHGVAPLDMLRKQGSLFGVNLPNFGGKKERNASLVREM